MSDWSRRRFLKGLGGVTLALPLFESLMPKAAFAQYVPQIAEYVLKTVDTAPSERLQETSVSILPFLVH